LQNIAKHCKTLQNIAKLILLLIFVMPVFSYSQPNNIQPPDFWATYNGWQDFFIANPDMAQGDESLYKAIEHWADFMKGRVGTAADPGSFEPIEDALMNLFDENTPICNNSVENASPWEFIGPKNVTNYQYIGIVNSVFVDQIHDSSLNTIYAGTNASGLWKTTNANASIPEWTCLTDNTRLPVLGVLGIAVSPVDADVIYIATSLNIIGVGGYGGNYGIGLLKTTDGGSHWNLTGLQFMPDNRINSSMVMLEPGNEDKVYCISNGTLYRSEDAGTSFEDLFIYPNTSVTGSEQRYLSDFEIKPGDVNTLYLAGYDNQPLNGDEATFYISHDAGDNWDDVTPSFNLPSGEKIRHIEIGVTPIQPNKIVLTCTTRIQGIVADHKYLLISTDGGISWTNNITSAEFETEKSQIAISPTDHLRIYTGGTWSSISGDGGSNFTGFGNFHADKRSFYILTDVTNHDALYVGHDGGISVYRFNTSISDYETINLNGTGLGITQFFGFDVSKDNNLVIGGTQDNHFYRLNNSVWSFTSGGDAYECLIDDNTPGLVYGETWGSTNSYLLKYSTNSGVSFNTTGINSLPLNKEIDTDRGEGVYIGTNNSIFKRQPGTLALWDEIGDYQGTVKTIAVSKSNSKVIFVANESPVNEGGKMWKTENADDLSNANWLDITPGLENAVVKGGISDIAVNPFYENQVWVCQGRFYENNRVHYSDDGGATWINVSAGLPPFPVDCLIFQEGTKGALYAGTDVGVFYNPDATDPASKWLCFNEGFPVCAVTDLEINYCENKIYAATYGRGIWMADLVPSQPLHITENTTWESNTTHYIDDLVIDPGVSLTIKGNVFISEMKTITVEKTARLYVDGGVLSNDCGKLWQGIEIIGDPNEDQYLHNGEYLQGYVYFSNGAVMEHSRQGFMTSGHYYDTNGNYVADYTTTGGIVKADNSTFRNNHRTAEILAYEYQNSNGDYLSNVCYFSQCTFFMDDDYRSTEPNDWHFPCFVSLYKVRGVRFLACSFQDTRANSPYEISGGHGIWSLDASFLVLPVCDPNTYPCENYLRSTFAGLNHGIDAGNWSGVYPYIVDRADFDGNAYGVYSTGVNNPLITRSDFNVGDKGVLKPMGIYLNTGTGYIVEENNFYSAGYNYPTTYRPLGIYARNTGSESNVIYKNTFDELYTGNVATGNNHNTADLNSGLQYHCNLNPDYEGNRYDFHVSNGRIAGNQGRPEINIPFPLPGFGAQNTFNLHTSPTWSDFYNNEESWPVNYFYKNVVPENNPLNVNLNVSFFKTLVNNSTNGCGSKLKEEDEMSSAGNRTALIEKISSLNDSIELLKIQYSTLIDDSNTEVLQEEIAEAWVSDSLDLYDRLHDISPWLTDSVLIDAADKTDVISDYKMFQLLKSNPDEAKKADLLEYMENKANPLPTAILDSLASMTKPVTARTLAEAKGSLLLLERNRIVNELLHYYVADSLWNPVLVESRLAEKHSLEATYGMIELYIAQGDVNNALALLGDIPATFKLTEEQVQEYAFYHSLKTLQVQIRQDNRNALQLLSDEITNVITIADEDPGIAGSQARALLNFAYGGQYHVEAPDIEGGAQGLHTEPVPSPPIVSGGNIISAYPNPAKDIVFFKSDLPIPSPEATLIIYDLFHNTIKEIQLPEGETETTWNTSQAASGIYIWQLWMNNKLTHTDRIAIVK
jgi:hypothetical protein